MARAIADVYGVDQGMIDTWSGMTQAERERASALLEMGDLMASGKEKTAGTYGSYYGLLPSMVDSYSEIAGRQNASALELARQKSAITGTGGSRGSRRSNTSSSSGSKTGSGGFTNSQLMSMSKDFKTMKPSDPTYNYYVQLLQKDPDGCRVADGQPVGIRAERGEPEHRQREEPERDHEPADESGLYG